MCGLKNFSFRFRGQFDSYPTETGTRWCIWLKWLSSDGVLSATPAGGTNGAQATTGKIGNTDLGPLIVEAANLAAEIGGHRPSHAPEADEADRFRHCVLA